MTLENESYRQTSSSYKRKENIEHMRKHAGERILDHDRRILLLESAVFGRTVSWALRDYDNTNRYLQQLGRLYGRLIKRLEDCSDPTIDSILEKFKKEEKTVDRGFSRVKATRIEAMIDTEY